VLGKNIYLGLFADEAEAALAYDAAACERFGEFAQTNFSPKMPCVSVPPASTIGQLESIVEALLLHQRGG
jgi:hypothetical protein